MQDGKIMQKGKFDEQQNIEFEVIIGAHSQDLELVRNAESTSRIPSENKKSVDSEDEFHTESTIEWMIHYRTQRSNSLYTMPHKKSMRTVD
jgi:hypothetical protein